MSSLTDPAPGLQPLPDSCATIALQRDEPLAGTATRVDTWFLLSCPEPWSADALRESGLPEAVKDHLAGLAGTFSNARVELIKDGDQGAPDRPVFFIAQSVPTSPRLYRIPLASYQELAELDPAPFLAGDPGVDHFAHPGPLFLTCTNGRRDPCCARLGLPVYRALRSVARNHTWQCSHIGGHRFAANVVVLPHGLYYGRVAPADVQHLVESARLGKLHLPLLRGRSSYDPPVQAAEVFLHQRMGTADAALYHLDAVKEAGADRWSVDFVDETGGLRHRLSLRASTSKDQAAISCRRDKVRPVVRYHLEHLQIES